MRLSLSVVASRLVPSAACSGRVLIAKLFDFNHTLGIGDVMIIYFLYFLQYIIRFFSSGRQKKPGFLISRHQVPVKTHPFPSFRQILEVLLSERGNENTNEHILYTRVVIELPTCRFTVVYCHTLVPLHHDWPLFFDLVSQALLKVLLFNELEVIM